MEFILFIALTVLGTKAWNNYSKAVREQEIAPTFSGYIEYVIHQIKRLIERA